jgi:hypothetical protein
VALGSPSPSVSQAELICESSLVDDSKSDVSERDSGDEQVIEPTESMREDLNLLHYVSDSTLFHVV